MQAAKVSNIISGLSPLCQTQFAAEDLGPAYGNITQAAIVSALGSQAAAALTDSSSCRRYPGVIG